MKQLIRNLGKKRIFYLACIAVLIGIGTALWPSARCAIGQGCNDRDYWCSEDCTKACAPATGFGYLDGCTYSYISDTCVLNWHPDKVNGTCSNPDNCNVVDVDMEDDRLFYISGVSYWNVGKCTKETLPNGRRICLLEFRAREVTCCVGMGEDPPEECEPSYGAPVIDTSQIVLSPPYPLVLGQDPDRLGVTVSGIVATGGADANQCGGGGAKITDLTASIALSDESTLWITGDLASRYYNAQVLGSYPAAPTATTIEGLNSNTATMAFHFNNPDPGWYNATVTATQEDGKTAQVVIRVRTGLLDATGTTP